MVVNKKWLQIPVYQKGESAENTQMAFITGIAAKIYFSLSN
jgi:hypothetical protein